MQLCTSLARYYHSAPQVLLTYPSSNNSISLLSKNKLDKIEDALAHWGNQPSAPPPKIFFLKNYSKKYEFSKWYLFKTGVIHLSSKGVVNVWCPSISRAPYQDLKIRKSKSIITSIKLNWNENPLRRESIVVERIKQNRDNEQSQAGTAFSLCFFGLNWGGPP